MTVNLSDDELLKAFSELGEDSSGLEEFYDALEGKRYSSEELVGEGGAKNVYKSCDRVTGRILARAFPKSDDEHTKAEFLREARLHSLLQHPNIIPVYDIGIDGEQAYFSMKYIKGQTVEELVNSCSTEKLQSPVYQNKVLDIFLKVCDAVAFAHSKNILHLDLKPANIHVSDYGEVLVGDWGLARIQGYDWSSFGSNSEGDFGQFTRYGFLSGTPGYMAPEQCIKGSVKGPFSDIYSLGAILLYLFTANESVKGSAEDKMESTKNGALSYSDEQVPAGLRSVISKALSLKPDQRYADVKSLANDINAYRSGYLTSAEESSFSKQLFALFRRNKKVSIVAFSATVLIAILSGGFIHRLQKERQRAIAQEKVSRDALDKYNKAEKSRIATTRKAYESFLKESENQYMSVLKGVTSYIPERDVRAYHLVSRALEFNSKLPGAWALKGKLAMLIGDFNDAAKSFEKAGKNYQLYQEISLKFSQKDLSDLPTFFAMLNELNKTADERLTNDFIFKTMFSDLSFEDHIFVVHEAMKLKNPGRKPLNFKFDQNRFALDISKNQRLKILYMIKNLPLKELNLSYTNIRPYDFLHLQKLPLTKLDVSNTHFSNKSMIFIKGKKLKELSLRNCKLSDLSILKEMPLEMIDISGTNCENVEVLSTLKSLKKVICSETQKSAIQSIVNQEKVTIEVR